MSGTPTRRSPEELRLQHEIDAVQREIDELATRIKRPKRKRGFSVDFRDSGSDGSHFGHRSATPATSVTPAGQSVEPAVVGVAVADSYSDPIRLPDSRVSAEPDGDGSLWVCSSAVYRPYPELSEVAVGSAGSIQSSAADSSRRSLPTIKFGTYDGSTPLDTHLAKLEYCSDYYQCSARDRLCHLKASLEGQAGKVLWQLQSDVSEADVVRLLRNRSGNVIQQNVFVLSCSPGDGVKESPFSRSTTTSVDCLLWVFQGILASSARSSVEMLS